GATRCSQRRKSGRTSRTAAGCSWRNGRKEANCMPGSMAACRTLKSPRSDTPGRMAQALPREWLSRSDREQMYGLLGSYFGNTSPTQFERDLAEKETVILLRSSEADRIVGFSTLMRIPAFVEGQRVLAFFSGDTIVAREHWGSPLLGRIWLRTVFAEA